MTTCICGQEIIAYYSDGENPSLWMHTAYAQPECLSKQLATPIVPEVLPTVECACGEIFTGSGRKHDLIMHRHVCKAEAE